MAKSDSSNPREPASQQVFSQGTAPASHEAVHRRKGRGALSNAAGRYEVLSRVDLHDDWNDGWDDGWGTESEGEQRSKTRWSDDTARKVITRNQSPDIYFDRSINPYRGCEHGCIYCFARPTHTYLGHSAGLDFERILYAKRDAAVLLEQELSHPSYQCEPIAVGVNTDAYQPLEKKLGITRQILQVLAACKHPAFMITKSALIERDIDLLQSLAQHDLVTVSISITTLDPHLARVMEPRAASPARRLKTLQRLSAAGIPVRVSISPIIPALNEHEMEQIVEQAALAGAAAASYIVLRLPHELSALFPQWLEYHFPDKASRVLNGLKSMRNDKLYDADFSSRMSGVGPRSEIIRHRFELACKRAGIAANGRQWRMCVDKFTPPAGVRVPAGSRSDTTSTPQLSLF